MNLLFSSYPVSSIMPNIWSISAASFVIRFELFRFQSSPIIFIYSIYKNFFTKETSPLPFSSLSRYHLLPLILVRIHSDTFRHILDTFQRFIYASGNLPVTRHMKRKEWYILVRQLLVHNQFILGYTGLLFVQSIKLSIFTLGTLNI